MNRTKFLVQIIIIFSAFLAGSKSFAYGSYRSSSSFGSEGEGWVIMPQGIYFFTTDSNGGNGVTVNRYVFDGSIGYHFQLLYLGAEFTLDQQVTTSSPTSTDTYKSYGAQIGFMTGGFQLLGSYYPFSTATTSGGTANALDYTGGTGFQILVGYLMDIGSGFSIGPELFYRSLTYTSRADGKPIGTNYTFSTFLPQLAIKYTF